MGQLLPERPPLGDVLDLGDDIGRPSGGVPGAGGSDRDPYAVAVGVEVPLLQVAGVDLPGDEGEEPPVVVLPVLGMGQVPEPATLQIIWRVPQYPAEGLVHLEHHTIAGGEPYADGRLLE
jgi:hypothetical protein